MKVCADTNVCTIDSVVQISATQRKCVHTRLSCDDGDLCTADTCDPHQGCSYQEIPCNDNLPCTITTCQPLKGCHRYWKSCDDDDSCTVDACEKTTGDCLHSPLPCKDNDPCAEKVCDPTVGHCVSVPTVCDDGDPCTIDSCQAALGCVYEPGGCEPPESPNFENLTSGILVMLVHDPQNPAVVLPPCAQQEVLLGGTTTNVPAGFVQDDGLAPPEVGVALCFDPYISSCLNEPAPLKQTAGLVFGIQPVSWLAEWSAVDLLGQALGTVYAKYAEATLPYYFPGVEFPGVDAEGAPVCTYSFALYICPPELKPFACDG